MREPDYSLSFTSVGGLVFSLLLAWALVLLFGIAL